jgi:hypothetical protein
MMTFKCVIFCKVATNSNVWPASVQMWPVEFTQCTMHSKVGGNISRQTTSKR